MSLLVFSNLESSHWFLCLILEVFWAFYLGLWWCFSDHKNTVGMPLMLTVRQLASDNISFLKSFQIKLHFSRACLQLWAHAVSLSQSWFFKVQSNLRGLLGARIVGFWGGCEVTSSHMCVRERNYSTPFPFPLLLFYPKLDRFSMIGWKSCCLSMSVLGGF